MLKHPSLDQLHALGLHGMAKAFAEIAAGGEADGLGPAALIWPAEVRLSRKRQPQANNSSAIKTAKGAPTTQPTMPTVCSPRRNV